MVLPSSIMCGIEYEINCLRDDNGGQLDPAIVTKKSLGVRIILILELRGCKWC